MTALPKWVDASPALSGAFALAEDAHRGQRRATDGRPFLEHVTEVATLLHSARFDDELVAVGLLHDAVERGSLTEAELRDEMQPELASLVMALSEDPEIEDFDDRKTALRDQVRAAGPRAITVFAADKLSDILGLRRGVARYGDAIEARMGTTASAMAAHYGESVAMIAAERPRSAFLPRLRLELSGLAADIRGRTGSGVAAL